MDAKEMKPCQGMNCGCTDGVNHSSECFAEHAATIAGGRFVKGFAAPSDAAQAPQFVNLEGLRAKLLTPREIQRDEDGFLWHPDYPICDEGTRADKFLEAFAIETKFVSMESDDPEGSERYFEAGEPDCSYWMPSTPEGEGWLLLEIYDTEDGPYAMFIRDWYAAEQARKKEQRQRRAAPVAPAATAPTLAEFALCALVAAGHVTQAKVDEALDIARTTPGVAQPDERAAFDIEAMLKACVPGGSICDPQIIADSLREWFAARATASQATHMERAGLFVRRSMFGPWIEVATREEGAETLYRVTALQATEHLDKRAAFEAWAKPRSYDLTRYSPAPYAAYRSDFTNGALAGWFGRDAQPDAGKIADAMLANARQQLLAQAELSTETVDNTVQNAHDARDAQRYRWLREHRLFPSTSTFSNPVELDIAIDAARNRVKA